MSLFANVIYKNANLSKNSNLSGRGRSQPSTDSNIHVKTMQLVWNEGTTYGETFQ